MLLVDAANVVGSRPDGWWRDRAGAARRLVEALRASTLPRPVVVVLEGAARAGEPEGSVDGVAVRHAPGAGDDLLVELAASADPPVVVVTADRGLRARLDGAGASSVGPRWLLDRLAQQRQ